RRRLARRRRLPTHIRDTFVTPRVRPRGFGPGRSGRAGCGTIDTLSFQPGSEHGGSDAAVAEERGGRSRTPAHACGSVTTTSGGCARAALARRAPDRDDR